MNKGNEKRPEDRDTGFKIFGVLMRPLFKLYYNPKIIGAENIPSEGAIVIACNHKHLYDQCLTIMATKRVIHYMAKREYFDGVLRPIFEACGCISVDRGRNDLTSVKAALKVLRRGGAIGIFPEGTRNRTEKFLLPFKPGATALAKRGDAYLVPAGVTGDYKFRSKNLTIRYGTPFKVGDMTDKEATKKLQEEIGKLMKQGMEEPCRK